MRLINTASTGTIELDQQLDTIIDYVDTEKPKIHAWMNMITISNLKVLMI